jgi:hypothetical protein
LHLFTYYLEKGTLFSEVVFSKLPYNKCISHQPPMTILWRKPV